MESERAWTSCVRVLKHRKYVLNNIPFQRKLRTVHNYHIYHYFYLLQLSFHSVAVALTLVAVALTLVAVALTLVLTQQIRITCFLYFATVHLRIILSIKPTWCTIYSYYIYQSLHDSSNYVPIIRRNNSVYVTLATCYSVWMTVWYTLHTRSHPYRITSSK